MFVLVSKNALLNTQMFILFRVIVMVPYIKYLLFCIHSYNTQCGSVLITLDLAFRISFTRRADNCDFEMVV